MWQGDPSLGQPAGLLQLLRAIPPELPAQRVADPGRLAVQRQPGAPRRRRAGGGRGRRCHSLTGLHVSLLALILLQPLLPASSFPPPAEAVGSPATDRRPRRTALEQRHWTATCSEWEHHPVIQSGWGGVGWGVHLTTDRDKHSWHNPNSSPWVSFTTLPANHNINMEQRRFQPHLPAMSRFQQQLLRCSPTCCGWVNVPAATSCSSTTLNCWAGKLVKAAGGFRTL